MLPPSHQGFPHEPGQRSEPPASHAALLRGPGEVRLAAPGQATPSSTALIQLPRHWPWKWPKPSSQWEPAACIESYVMSRMLSEGPKVFAFDALTCEALENFDLSVSTADYLQPFPTVVIELPAGLHARSESFRSTTAPMHPIIVIVRHEPKAGCVLVLDAHDQPSGADSAAQAGPGLDAGGDVGERATHLGCQGLVGHDAEEKALGSSLSKLALNVCLMATAYGVQVPGACQSVALRAAEEVCEAGPKARAGSSRKRPRWKYGWLRCDMPSPRR